MSVLLAASLGLFLTAIALLAGRSSPAKASAAIGLDDDLRGERGGHSVSLRTAGPGRIVAHVHLAFSAGQALRVGSEGEPVAPHGQKLLARGSEETIAGLLGNERVHALLARGFRWDAIELAGSVLSVTRTGKLEDGDRLLHSAVRLAKALEHAWEHPWQQCAELWGLRWAGGTLHGRVAGHTLTVRMRGDASETHVRVFLKRALPPGARARAGPGGLRVDDPLLDEKILLFPAFGPIVTAHLAALRQPLSDALGTWPGSELSEHGLTIRIPGRALTSLEPAIRAGLALAEALDTCR